MKDLCLFAVDLFLATSRDLSMCLKTDCCVNALLKEALSYSLNLG